MRSEMTWTTSSQFENPHFEFRNQLKALILEEDLPNIDDDGWNINLESVGTIDEMWKWINGVYVEEI